MAILAIEKNDTGQARTAWISKYSFCTSVVPFCGLVGLGPKAFEFSGENGLTGGIEARERHLHGAKIASK